MPKTVRVRVKQKSDNKNWYDFTVQRWNVDLKAGDTIVWECTYQEGGGAPVHVDPVKIVFFTETHFGVTSIEGPSPLTSPPLTDAPTLDTPYRYRIRLFEGEASPKPYVIDPEYERRP